VNDYYDDNFEWPGEINDLDGKIDHLNLECPICGSKGDFITDQTALESMGYSLNKEYASRYEHRYSEFGICIGNCSVRPEDRSTLKLQSGEAEGEGYISFKEDGTVCCTQLIFLNLTEQQLDERIYRTGATIIREQFDVKYHIKSLYRSAFTEERYRKLDPPYSVARRVFMMNATKEMIMNATSGNTERDWFQNLLNSLKIFEFDLKDNKVKKNQTSSRLVYGLICTYLHKTVEMRNIEPLWSFVKRMNIGNRQIIKGMNKWMKPIPSLHESQIQSLAYHQSSPQSIRSLMANIKSFATDIKLNSDELKEIEIEAIRIHKLLTDETIGNGVDKVSIAEHINLYAKFTPTISIEGNVFPAIGLVEALCVRHAANNCLNGRKARVLEKKYLFPKANGDPWWRRELTAECRNIVDVFPHIMISISNRVP
jgi:hypothetical protein